MPPLIELIDIARHYRMGDQQIAALDGVRFTIDRGELVAIVGSSGSGKSTLLNVLGCLDTPTRGRYPLDGQGIQDLGDDERARLRNRQIGFVLQRFQLLHRATAQEIAASRHADEVDLQVRAALRDQRAAALRVIQASKSRTLAGLSLEIENRKYASGTSPNLGNLAIAKAQNDFASAELIELGALLTRAQAATSLLLATGQLLDKRHVKVQVAEER